jgi:hypothetical protein
MTMTQGSIGSDLVRDAAKRNISISFLILSKTVASRKTMLGLCWLHNVSGNLEKIWYKEMIFCLGCITLHCIALHCIALHYAKPCPSFFRLTTSLRGKWSSLSHIHDCFLLLANKFFSPSQISRNPANLRIHLTLIILSISSRNVESFSDVTTSSCLLVCVNDSYDIIDCKV